MPANHFSPWILALCYRSGYLTLAAFGDGDLIEVRVKRLRNRRDRSKTMRALIQKFALDYAVDGVVVEPGSRLEELAQALSLPTIAMSLKQAKALLLPERQAPTHGQLYELLIKENPKFRRLVNVNPKNGKPLTQQWRLLSLLSVALGLAALKKVSLPSSGQSTLTTTTPHSYSYVHSTSAKAPAY